MRERWRGVGGWLAPVVPPLLLCGLLYLLLHEPLQWWLHGEEIYDEQTMKEWVREARIGIRSLPEMLQDFADLSAAATAALKSGAVSEGQVLFQHEQKREEIREMLRALGSPPTKIYTGQLPLFPVIYRLEVVFDDAFKLRCHARLNFAPIAWDSESPRHPTQYQELPFYPLVPGGGAGIRVEYHLHAYMQKQFKERADATRRLSLTVGGAFLAGAAVFWIFLAQRRERERERRRLLAEQRCTRRTAVTSRKSCAARKRSGATRRRSGAASRKRCAARKPSARRSS
jgi:hypothetical protein